MPIPARCWMRWPSRPLPRRRRGSAVRMRPSELERCAHNRGQRFAGRAAKRRDNSQEFSRIPGHRPCSKGELWKLERPLSRSSPRRVSLLERPARFSRAGRPQARLRRLRPRLMWRAAALTSPKASLPRRRPYQHPRPPRPGPRPLRLLLRHRRNLALKVLALRRPRRRRRAPRLESRTRLQRQNNRARRSPSHVQSPRRRRRPRTTE